MIQITFQFTDIAAAAALLAKLNGHEAAAIVEAPAPAVVKAVAKAAGEAPGKPSAATTAPSPRTAEAAPSPSAQPDAAPAPSPEATPPAAAAPSASQPADKPVAYADLQKAVLTLHKRNPTAAVPIAKSLGADTFKALPEAKWAEALRLVTEAIAAEDARG